MERAPAVGVLVNGVFRGGFTTAGPASVSAWRKTPTLEVTEFQSGVKFWLREQNSFGRWFCVQSFSFGAQREEVARHQLLVKPTPRLAGSQWSCLDHIDVSLFVTTVVQRTLLWHTATASLSTRRRAGALLTRNLRLAR